MVEMAICLPLFVFLVFGTVEINEAIFRKQTMTSAAHEGALLGMKSATTQPQIEGIVQAVLNSRGLEDCTIEVDSGGTDISLLAPGSEFTVRVITAAGSSRFGLDELTVEVTAIRP